MSSYRGHFSDLSPSDQADIASWSEPDEADQPEADEIEDLLQQQVIP